MPPVSGRSWLGSSLAKQAAKEFFDELYSKKARCSRLIFEGGPFPIWIERTAPSYCADPRSARISQRTGEGSPAFLRLGALPNRPHDAIRVEITFPQHAGAE
jgi:hypothetical protein